MPITCTTGALTYNKTPLTDDWTYWYLKATSANTDFSSIAVNDTDLYVTDPKGSVNSNESYYYNFTIVNSYPQLVQGYKLVSAGMYGSRNPVAPFNYGVFFNKITLDNNGVIYLYGSQTQLQATTLPYYDWTGAVTILPSSVAQNSTYGSSILPEPGDNNQVYKYAFDSSNNPWTIMSIQIGLSNGQGAGGYSDFGPRVSQGGTYTDDGDYFGQTTNQGTPLLGQASGRPTGLSVSTTGKAFSACWIKDIYTASPGTIKSYITYTDTTITPPYQGLDKIWQRQFDGYSYGLVSDSADNVYAIIDGTKLVKYNSTGTQQWVKTVTSMSGGELAIDSNDDIYWTSGPRIVKLDSSGTLIWGRQLNKTIAGFEIRSTNMFMCGSSFILKLPTDGTLTGTYDNLIYFVITPTVSASTLSETIITNLAGNYQGLRVTNATKTSTTENVTSSSFAID